MAMVETAVLRDSVLELQSRVEEQRARLAELQSQLDANEQELALLAEVLRLRGEPLDGVPHQPSNGQHPLLHARQLSENNGTRGNGPELAEAVVEVLREHGTEMAIQDLLAAVTARGIKVPGQGKPANLIAHIGSHADIVRTARGVYGLRELGHKPATASKRKPRRRSKSPRATTRRQASVTRNSVTSKSATDQ